ncbi:sensor histidine kinase [Planctomonas deserti]|uniref:sensor histidine kinase n=1 Tax=Planctomonas deserti TaxID=2144185 RepID=UPI001F0BFC0C|nr:sensor histidine kinase [Planctomonas deserti]
MTDTPAPAIPASPASPAAAERRTTYLGLWRSVPRELGFLLLALPLALVSFTVVLTLFSTGLSLLAVFVGVFLVIGALIVARAFGTLEMARLEWAGRPAISRPLWTRAGDAVGFWPALLRVLANGHYWLHLLHAIVVNFLVSLVTWTITFTWLTIGLSGTTYWIWDAFVPDGDRGDFWLYRVVLGWFSPDAVPAVERALEPGVLENLFFLLVGLFFLASLPLVTRGFTLLHDVIGRSMLGAWRSEFLQREVADLSASRGAALVAEDQSLRRLERDIHDGPQQRLVRLQMDLASAERRLETDPDGARRLLGEAMQQSRDTLEELRALSRGFAPPILQDRGLVAGLASLAATSAVPVRVSTDLDPAAALPPEIERNAYFVAAELLANVAKHSGATDSVLHSALRQSEDGGRWLDITVTDNGRGGAALVPGHGLAGLADRLRGLRGVLTVDSPAGGPSVLAAHIPVPPPAHPPLI